MVKSAYYLLRKMRKMISRKRLNLFPIIFEYKICGLSFRRLGHCCNMDHYALKKLILLHFMFRDIYYWKCPQCGKVHGLKMSWHTETYFDKQMREDNQRLERFRHG